MNRVSPAFVGLCFLLGACSGPGNEGNTDGTPDPTAGSGGMVASGGELPALGGSPEAGGAPGTAGGGTGGDAVAGGGSAGESMLGGAGGTSGSTGGSAGAAGTGGKPPIDFSIWQLQLPTGSGTSPDTISSAKLLAGYESAYFKKADDGGYVFMDPAHGIHTPGSTRCRSEFREMKGTAGAAWSSSGTNVMDVSGKVTLMSGGSKGSTTVGQVFVAGDNGNTLCELQYNGSQFKVFYEESKGNGEGPFTLAGTVAMKTKYTFTLSLTKGVLDVSINGKVLWTRKPTSAVSGKTFYFKVGNYDQTTSEGTPTTTPYTEVEAYTIDVVHS